ncbi:MAG: DUF1574 family protein [Leptonema sp. (in: bacteria)]
MKNKIFLYPTFLFLFLFLLDKIFLIKKIQFLTQKDATFIYYQYKTELLEKLKYTYQRQDKKILILIGSSRLMFVDYSEFKKLYPDWEMFNFSVPVNSPSYYLFILEKIFKNQIQPDLILLETDPYQFNEFSPGFRKSNLPYTFDLSFVIRYFNLFEREEVSEFLGYSLFAGKRYPPDIPTLIERLRNPNEKILQIFYKTELFQRENNGCGLPPIPLKEWYIRNLAEIELSAKGTIEWLYRNYKYSERQWIFFEKTINLLREKQAKFILVKPQVSPIMEEMLLKNPKIQYAYLIWNKKIKEIIQPNEFIDFSHSQSFFCNTFVDGSHMSLECYDPLLFQVLFLYENSMQNR